ncbi:MAG: serine/threonine-protein kinase [Gemmataceae bacterium]
MIQFLCSNCGAPLRVPPEKAGSTGKCPRCGQYVEAPLDGGSGMTSQASSANTPRVRDDRGTFEAASGGRDDLGFLAPPQATDEIGRLGNYRVLKVLGSGGMGIVFQAEDLKLRRQVALKVMKKAMAQSAVNRGRFRREAQTAASIEHDHIVPIYAIDEDRGVPYLAMKLLVGESLEERLNRVGKLPTEEVLRIGKEIAEGLAAAHEKGLVHRDIKPANIWLEEGKGRVKLVDFGLAAWTEDSDTRLTQENFLVGTPMYMSPEQASGDIPLDHRTDLFSLGSVMYRMCTGTLPFKGKTTLNVLAALATKKPKTPRERNPEVPKALSGLIMQLLQKRPDDRPRTARDVVRGLEDVKNSPPGDENDIVEDVRIEALAVDEDPGFEPEPAVQVGSGARLRPARRRRGSRGPAGPERLTAEEQLERKVIRFAIFAGVCVFLLLSFLVVQRVFFKAKTDEPPPPVIGGP